MKQDEEDVAKLRVRILCFQKTPEGLKKERVTVSFERQENLDKFKATIPVSYTHLTLPTIYSV